MSTAKARAKQQKSNVTIKYAVMISYFENFGKFSAKHFVGDPKFSKQLRYW